MIKNLNISNFQSHKNTSLEFAPGVNVIVGASDSGKTAILRALRWLIWNRPSGEAFRSTWGGDTEVFIETDTDYITRYKGKGGNGYNLSEETLEGFGQDVPEPVQKALNIDETNLQQQLDAPFLISESPGEVAKYFNQIAHLDQIDSGLKYLNSQIRQLDSKRGFIVEQQVEVDEALKGFEYLDEVEKDMVVLERSNTNLEQNILAFNRLRYLTEELSKIEDSQKEIKVVLDFEQEVDAIIKGYESLQEIQAKKDSLISTSTWIAQVDRKIDKEKKAIELESSVDAILFKMKKRDELEQNCSDLKRHANNMEANTDQINTLISNIVIAEDEFAFNMPDICPLCEQKIPHGTNKNN